MVESNKDRNLIIITILSIFLFITVSAFMSSDNIFNPLSTSISSGGEINFAIPHKASYKCEPTEDKNGITVSVPEGGAIISKETVGFHTNGISSIKILSEGNWKSSRIRYFICDQNGNNCGQERILYTQSSGSYNIYVSSLNFETQSLKIYSEQIGTVQIWNYFYWDGIRVSFDGTAFGLTLSSTIQNPAGEVVCSTSCNIDCPDIGFREKMILTDDDSLDFYDTASYIEYWEDIDYDLNEQAGATIYNPSKEEFCFAGAIYDAGELEMDNGVTYIYPMSYQGREQCCPGATISSTYSDKICQNDYTWKTIDDNDILSCLSDFNCPNSGGDICQNRMLSSYGCEDRDENGVGICKKSEDVVVDCCVNADCAIDQVCDTNLNECKGGTILPVCGDGNLDAGEQCDDGNKISGDGCSTVCENEIEFCELHPEDPICKENECDTCDAFAKSALFGWATDGTENDLTCSAKTILGVKTQSPFICFLAFLKLLAIPFFFIFSLILGFNTINKIMGGEYKGLSWSLAIILAGVIGVLTYFLFYVGLVILIIIGVIRIAIGFIPGLNLSKRRRK